MTLAASSDLARTPSTPAIDVHGIARRYGNRWALRGIDLRVQIGQAVALVGRNGSGKTTLLRILATLSRPTRGGGRIQGLDLHADRASIRAHVGLLGHRTALYEDLTARENLVFARRMHGLAADGPIIADVLAEVGLEAEAEHRVRSFSAGMRRRLALGRLMLARPRLLLLDEPFASFDPEGIDLLRRFIADVSDDGGTVIVATHDVPRAAPIVDRFVRLELGRVVDDSPAPRAGASSRGTRPIAVVAGDGGG